MARRIPRKRRRSGKLRAEDSMPLTHRVVRALLPAAAMAIALSQIAAPAPSADAIYYPAPGQWEHKKPADVGMDAAKLNEAIAFMKAHENEAARDFSDQEKTFGKLLGSVPTERAPTNALVIRHGYIVAEFGETTRPDPTYSVAKSMLSTVAAIALSRGLIPNLDDPVANVIKDGGYDSPHNRLITWRNHLQQASEWEGELWGKNANFLGKEAFGAGEMKPREIKAPGTFYEYNDVRINRFSLSLLELFKKQVPDVFRDEVMNPIGASNTWKWVPYANSYTMIDGKRMASVSGGTRWGGGVWISTYDEARFGLLWMRHGRWGDRQIVPESYIKMATAPSSTKHDYGFLWWLNNENKVGLPMDSFEARGAGGNIIYVDPANDLVVVWRWSAKSSEGFRKVVDAIVTDSH
jgi:CubicO group peptidase (beta-lactamase class C family)